MHLFEEKEIMRQNEVKRVLLLVLLIVSLVELDWERDRIYLWSSLASALLMLWAELSSRRNVHRPVTANKLVPEQRVSPQTSVAYLPDQHFQPRLLGIVESAAGGARPLVPNNSS